MENSRLAIFKVPWIHSTLTILVCISIEENKSVRKLNIILTKIIQCKYVFIVEAICSLQDLRRDGKKSKKGPSFSKWVLRTEHLLSVEKERQKHPIDGEAMDLCTLGCRNITQNGIFVKHFWSMKRLQKHVTWNMKWHEKLSAAPRVFFVFSSVFY